MEVLQKWQIILKIKILTLPIIKDLRSFYSSLSTTYIFLSTLFSLFSLATGHKSHQVKGLLFSNRCR